MANGHGGRRPGAGRPRKLPVVNNFADPLDFLRATWSGEIAPTAGQLRAAVAAMPYTHKKLGEGGAKDQTQRAAVKVASRFAPAAPPRLVVSNGPTDTRQPAAP